MIVPHYLAPGYAVARQLKVADVADIKALGFAGIVNNRPDNEVLPMWNGAAIEAEARTQGLSYRALPVDGTQITLTLAEELARIMATADGPLLGYCSSGARSAVLWGLAAARAGGAPDTLRQAAAREGYDLGPAMLLMEDLARRGTGGGSPLQERVG